MKYYNMAAILVTLLIAVVKFTVVFGSSDDSLKFTARLETIDPEDSVVDLFSDLPSLGGSDYLLHLDATIGEDDPRIEDVLNEEAVLITVVDNSGSMHGTPWKQVQEGLLQQLRMVHGNKNIETRIITYNSQAKEIKVGDLQETETEIGNIQAGGSTNFVSAFETIGDILNEINDKRNIFILMMTDGMDTVNRFHQLKAARNKLEKLLNAYGGNIVVNVLGFGDHDEDFLEGLTYIGTSDGMYSYVSYKEGPASIKERMTQIMESVTTNMGKNVFLTVEMVDEGTGILADWMGKSSTLVTLPAGIKELGNGLVKISTRKFVKLAKADILPSISVGLVKSLDLDAKPIKAEVTKITIEYLKEIEDILSHNLKKLRTCINLLASAAATSKSFADNNKINDWFQYIGEVTGKLNGHVQGQNKNLLESMMKVIALYKDVIEEEDEIEQSRRHRSFSGYSGEALKLQHNQVRYQSKEDQDYEDVEDDEDNIINQWVDKDQRKASREARYGADFGKRVVTGDFNHDEL